MSAQRFCMTHDDDKEVYKVTKKECKKAVVILALRLKLVRAYQAAEDYLLFIMCL